MSYKYENEKAAIFTEYGQVLFTSIRDRVRRLLKYSGAVRLQEAVAGECGDYWHFMACIDRMVELGEIIELEHSGSPGQHRVFVNKTLLEK